MTEDRTSRLRWQRIAAIGVLLPLLAAALLIWSASGRQAKLDQVPVAIVNNDQIITDPQPMAAGRSLTAALTHPDAGTTNLDWVLTDSKDATAGLHNGAYYAVLTIPTDFSSSILSSGTDQPQQGKLTLVSNAAASTTVPYISQQIAAAAAASLGQQVTQGYLKNVYAGFNQIAQSNAQAASSAAQLASGTQQLSAGAAQLSTGASQLASSLGQVASGTAQLAAGAASVQSGATQVRTGAAGVASGARRIHTATAAVADKTHTLARASSVLAAGSRALSVGAGRVSTSAHAVAGDAGDLADEVSTLSAECAAQGGSASFCDALAAADLQGQSLATDSGRLDDRAGLLARAATGISTGSSAVARGNVAVAGKLRVLSGGTSALSTSANRLLAGATSLEQGADALNSAAGQLTTGTQAAAQGGSSLASGASTLAASASQVNDGAQQLSAGLAKGATQTPTYTDDQQTALASVVSQPVLLTARVQYTDHGNGWLIALIVGAILWLAALVAALSRDLTGIVRNALSPVSSRRLAMAQALPVIGLGLVQAASVVIAVLLVHRSTASAIPLALLTLLASTAFTALALALRLAFGRVGVTIYVLFLVVQLAASSNVVPLETAPAALRRLNVFMPLTAYTNGASQLVSGGHVASYVGVVVVLAVWTAGAFALMVTVVRRARGTHTVSGRVELAPA